jgi:demethylmenaquinone methyltransferase / 2-methoxy-6-polyprenyl-1,4-benzoquinol methylase
LSISAGGSRPVQDRRRIAVGLGAAAEKSAFVQRMFDAIAPRYDLLNSLLSLGTHRRWRRFAARCAALGLGDSVLDVCAGTGELGKDLRALIGSQGLLASVDFSLPMLRAGDARYAATAGARAQVDALRLPFAADSFDAALVAFGLRNVADPQQGLCEMVRVVKPGGRVVVLEFAQPRPQWFAAIFKLYSRTVMPILGGLISGTRDAYIYLPESVARWKSRTELTEMMAAAGLTDLRRRDVTLGIACVHVGTR